MITFRYHIVSLVSVFLALAIGIALGGGPLKGEVDNSLVKELAARKKIQTEQRQEIRRLRASASFADGYAKATAPTVLAGQLRGRARRSGEHARRQPRDGLLPPGPGQHLRRQAGRALPGRRQARRRREQGAGRPARHPAGARGRRRGDAGRRVDVPALRPAPRPRDRHQVQGADSATTPRAPAWSRASARPGWSPPWARRRAGPGWCWS